jgi:hypothetical protein
MGGHISKSHSGKSTQYKEKRDVRDKRQLHRQLHRDSKHLYEMTLKEGDIKHYNRTHMRIIKAFLIREDPKYYSLIGQIYLSASEKAIPLVDTPQYNFIVALRTNWSAELSARNLGTQACKQFSPKLV